MYTLIATCAERHMFTYDTYVQLHWVPVSVVTAMATTHGAALEVPVSSTEHTTGLVLMAGGVLFETSA